MNLLQIQPLDPLMIRDGRPFDATPGARAHTLSDVSPSVLAGTIRTLLGKMSCSSSYNGEAVKRSDELKVQKIIVRGPLYERNGTVYYPMPEDVGFYEKDNSLHASIRRPAKVQDSEGFYGTGRMGLHDQLWPAVSSQKQKAAKQAPAYISAELMTKWLCNDLSEQQWHQALLNWKTPQSNMIVPEDMNDNVEKIDKGHNKAAEHFLDSFARQERVHTAIDTETYAAKDQQLYSTESLVLPDDLTLLAEVNLKAADVKWPSGLSEVHSFGGKRRLAHFSESTDQQHWTCPAEILDTIDEAKYIRMVLATPAYFSKGWIPGELNENLQCDDFKGTGVGLQLRWACVPRWQPISGWNRQHGEKAVRRMVPAGSVYFFEVLGDANPRDLVEKLWLQTVSDKNRRKEAFDNEDGFGLALWGSWKPTEQERGEK